MHTLILKGSIAKMKSVELKLVSELMKNSRRSDRELAKVLGVSQPTVTRTRTRLEKEGYIKEYTLIPDFKKLGYHIMAMIYLRLNHPLSPKEREEMFRGVLQVREEDPRSFLLAMDGIGLDQDVVLIALFRDFSEYSSYIQWTRTEMTGKLKLLLHPTGITSFLVNLDAATHFQPLTFSRIALNLRKAIDRGELSDTS
jgi:Lrp/AsnC family transcriptional regulator for asnA, asnC and gidA